jgi:hypothetical protein
MRLRSISGDFIDAAVAKSAFFSGFPWDALLHMTMEAPFVPTPLPAFDQVYTSYATENTDRRKSAQQSAGEVTPSYLESTTASRYASIDPSKDPGAHTSQPVEEDGDAAERKRQFYVTASAPKKLGGEKETFADF